MPGATTILGISAYYHDSAAALLVDGDIVAAAQEERFTRVKHDYRFPHKATEYCLSEAGISADDLDYVVFYDKPLTKFDRLLETYLAYAPKGLKSFGAAMPLWLKTKLHMPREIRQSLGGAFKKPISFTRHHESHAASAFYPSPFDEAAVVTIDGVGEWDTATIGHGKGCELAILKSLRFPHSLGLLYSAFTYFTGFRVNSGEYKLMGLAPYGEPKYVDTILSDLIDLKEDGSLAMDMRYFNYCEGLRMTSPAFDELFDGPPRSPESPITKREMDLAASIQAVTEEVVIRMAREAKRLTDARHLCLAGGVALNCVANGRLLRERIFEDIWIQPAAGDAGGALGAALFVHHQLLRNPKPHAPEDRMRGAYLGPAYKNEDVAARLRAQGAVFREFAEESELLTEVASQIANGSVVGWFHGRMEFGPRALGGRSIIGDPRSPEMQSTMNLRIKFRESFRPFAPTVLEEDVTQYFELDSPSPYMLLVADVQPSIRKELDEEALSMMKDPDLRKVVNVPRSEIPAVTHVDMSARVQTVSESRNGRYYRLLREFKRQTGCGVLINTSFNVRGEPIVCEPEDAYRCFRSTDMDVLVVENCLLIRSDQSKIDETERQRYVDSFQLD